MNRRRFLGAAATGLALALAGCSQGEGTDAESTPTSTATESTPASTPTATPAASTTASGLRNPDLPLDESDLLRAAGKDDIPAIVDPVFGEDWSDVDATLASRDRVIGVEIGGEARAYPLPVLNWHEVVNDTFDGPLLVTYCPLCGSGVTADRLVDGEETVFGVSGYLWNSDLVMYDARTESLWSQVLGKAVRGPKTGTALSLVPSTITTWGEWREEHPDTSVLLPPPKSNTVTGETTRNYDRNPYESYEDSSRVGIRGENPDERLHPKASVIGVASGGTARAYPMEVVRERGGVVNDRVGELPVVVAATPGGSLVAYVRRVDGETLEFARDDEVLTAGGSRWNMVSGEAIDGPYEGTTLERANDRSEMFWFAWADFYPNTEIYGE